MPNSIKAVVFDMDGTITVPALDFPRMKAQIGLPQGQGLLESLSRLSGAGRAAAEEILLGHELAAARDSVLNEGVCEALSSLARMGIKRSILTRNCRAGVDMVLEKHGLDFDAVVTREDSPPKPNPDGVHMAAERMGVAAGECIMVGDYEFDITAGRAAGAVTVLYAREGRSLAVVPDFEIHDMTELVGIVRDLNGR